MILVCFYGAHLPEWSRPSGFQTFSASTDLFHKDSHALGRLNETAFKLIASCGEDDTLKIHMALVLCIKSRQQLTFRLTIRFHLVHHPCGHFSIAFMLSILKIHWYLIHQSHSSRSAKP